MSKINSLLKKAAFFEKLAVYGDRKDFLKAIAQVTPMVGGTPEAEAYLNQFETPTQTTKEVVIEAPKTIDPEIQNMLNHILDRKIVPLFSDGKLGPQTRNALNLFVKDYGPATKSNITNVFKNLNNAPASKPSPASVIAPMQFENRLNSPDMTHGNAEQSAGAQPRDVALPKI